MISGDIASMNPSLVVLAGPNGAGKTTASARILEQVLGIDEFVNADIIAQGLSGFAPENAAFQAGRIMLTRLRELAEMQSSFAFETTLASRSFAPWIRHRKAEGYSFHLFFFWLPSAEVAIQRVAQRVRLGGHMVDDETVRRRYRRSIENFFQIYRPLTTSYQFYDNSQPPAHNLVARGSGRIDWIVERPAMWQFLKEFYDSSRPTPG